MDDTKIVVISSPGSMATRWLAQCFSMFGSALMLIIGCIVSLRFNLEESLSTKKL